RHHLDPPSDPRNLHDRPERDKPHINEYVHQGEMDHVLESQGQTPVAGDDQQPLDRRVDEDQQQRAIALGGADALDEGLDPALEFGEPVRMQRPEKHRETALDGPREVAETQNYYKYQNTQPRDDLSARLEDPRELRPNLDARRLHLRQGIRENEKGHQQVEDAL